MGVKEIKSEIKLQLSNNSEDLGQPLKRPNYINVSFLFSFFLCSPNVFIFSTLMHYISSSCWNLLPCILKTRSCTFFSSGRNLSPKLPPSLSDIELLVNYHDFPLAQETAKLTNLKAISTRQNPLKLCFRESNRHGFVFTSGKTWLLKEKQRSCHKFEMYRPTF